MNNMSTCECSSGCESGWTMYLDQSLNSGDGKWSYHEDDEDLSMVSDASSGPTRHKIHDEDEDEESKYGFCYGLNSQEKRKTRLKKDDDDDTASSTVFTKV
ncbi:hypothetical protein Ccrd_022162 [Cynara cardunculus var. scolymus]|uniref:Uncharacterized protein n=1 Tax=Cynara cardunculus var. scolymus TaxID=59895 RepID=A0A103XZ74_CYNCS|nr:hypothetical protein Ccrd_022162 [Cynara cardunculus var. scolymus]